MDRQIYVVQAGENGPLKIGISNDIAQRMQMLQCACPYDLKLLLAFPASEQQEKRLHHRLRGFRLRGEWFQCDPLVLELLTGIAASPIQLDDAATFDVTERLMRAIELRKQGCTLTEIGEQLGLSRQRIWEMLKPFPELKTRRRRLMSRRNGVDLALEKAGGGPEAHKTLANLFDPPLTVPAIYRFRRKGWFPLERAKVIAEKYGLALHDLVRDDIREALLDNNS